MPLGAVLWLGAAFPGITYGSRVLEMRFEGDMEIKRFIDVPLSEFFTFHVYTTFYF